MIVQRAGVCLVFAVGILPWVLGGCRSEPVSISVFHVNDLHAQLRARKTGDFGLGGVARLGTLLEELRRTRPLSVTLDAGDSWQGSWHASIDQGAGMLGIFGLLKFDALTLGSHDQVPGPDALLRGIQNAPAPAVLAANLDASRHSDPDAIRRALPPAIVKKVGDLKVGVIGLTQFDLSMPSMMEPVKVTDPLTTAAKLAAELRPQVDVLIVTSHNGLETNFALASAIPGIDAMISGGSHRQSPRPWMAKNLGREIPVVEAGQDGQFIGELRLQWDAATKSVRMENYALHAVADNIAESAAAAAAVSEMDRKLALSIGQDPFQTIAASEEEVPYLPGIESPFGNFVAQAYRLAADAELSIDQLSQDRPGLPAGELSLMDLHDSVPPSLKVKVWKARGRDFTTVMNLFFTAKSIVPFASPLGWLSTDQVQWIWEPSRDEQGRSFPAIKSIKVQGRTIDEQRWYRVALTDRFFDAIRRADETFHLGLDLTQTEEVGVPAWQAVVAHAGKAGMIRSADVRVGGRSFTLGADLGVSGTFLQWREGGLEVSVSNHGLTRSGAGKVSCERANFKSLGEYETPEQSWSLIGEVSLPVQEPGQTHVVRVPWDADPAGLPRFVPVRCDVAAPGDAFSPNNRIQRVFTQR